MKLLKGIVAGFITGMIVAFCVTVFADYISVELNKVTLYVNSVRVKGDTILHKSTTYVPLRAIAEMLDKDVFWDDDLKTASINDKRPPTDYSTKGYSFSSIQIDTKGSKYYSKIIGEIENNNSRKRSLVTFTFNFYDRSNRLLGVAQTAVYNLDRNERRSFFVYGDPIDDFYSYKVQIDEELY